MPEPRTPAEIRRWLSGALGEVLELDPREIDPSEPLIRYGLDSLAVVMVAGELEDWLGHPLPGDLLRSEASVNSVAATLALLSAAGAGSAATAETPATRARGSRGAQALLAAVRWLVGALMRVEVNGRERLPKDGAYIVAINHLHALDAVLVFVTLPEGVVFFAADKFRRIPIVNAFLVHAGEAIYVARGEADRPALLRALAVLQSGGRLAIAPEGKVSRPGLSAGRSGVAYLAQRAGVPIVPVAIHGHHRPLACWLRLRRVPAWVQIGEPISPPSGPGGATELYAVTHALMVTLAQMLPREHRGAYAAAADAAGPALAGRS